MQTTVITCNNCKEVIGANQRYYSIELLIQPSKSFYSEAGYAAQREATHLCSERCALAWVNHLERTKNQGLAYP